MADRAVQGRMVQASAWAFQQLRCSSHKHITISRVTLLLMAPSDKACLPAGPVSRQRTAVFQNTDPDSSAGGTAWPGHSVAEDTGRGS